MNFRTAISQAVQTGKKIAIYTTHSQSVSGYGLDEVYNNGLSELDSTTTLINILDITKKYTVKLAGAYTATTAGNNKISVKNNDGGAELYSVNTTSSTRYYPILSTYTSQTLPEQIKVVSASANKSILAYICIIEE